MGIKIQSAHRARPQSEEDHIANIKNIILSASEWFEFKQTTIMDSDHGEICLVVGALHQTQRLLKVLDGLGYNTAGNISSVSVSHYGLVRSQLTIHVAGLAGSREDK